LKELFFTDLVRDDLGRVEDLLREHYPGQHEAIGVAVDHLVGGGGKRLRPALVLLSAYLCGAEMAQAAFAAAAVEMLHTATLIHDDLIDGALVRRGMETLNVQWSPSVTVLTGDYVFAYAAYLAARANSVQLMRRFSETLMVICNGEIQQMFNGRHDPPDRQEYEQRIYAKTASLLAMSAESGPILGGAEESTTMALRTYGEQLGMAFQIVDDVLDYSATDAGWGKQVGKDFLEGKATLPLIIAFHCASAKDKLLIKKFFKKPERTGEDYTRLMKIIKRANALETAGQRAVENVETAKKHLKAFPDSPAKKALLDLADYVVSRTV